MSLFYISKKYSKLSHICLSESSFFNDLDDDHKIFFSIKDNNCGISIEIDLRGNYKINIEKTYIGIIFDCYNKNNDEIKKYTTSEIMGFLIYFHKYGFENLYKFLNSHISQKNDTLFEIISKINHNSIENDLIEMISGKLKIDMIIENIDKLESIWEKISLNNSVTLASCLQTNMPNDIMMLKIFVMILDKFNLNPQNYNVRGTLLSCLESDKIKNDETRNELVGIFIKNYKNSHNTKDYRCEIELLSCLESRKIQNDKTRIKFVKIFLDNFQYDLNYRKYGDNTILMKCIFSEQIQNDETRIELVKIFLNHPCCDPNVKGKRGNTFMMKCLNLNQIQNDETRIEIIKMILDHPQCDPNIEGKYERTSLMWCIRSDEFNNQTRIEIIKMILDHPLCDPNIEDEEGISSLMICLKTNKIGNQIKNEIAKMIINHPKYRHMCDKNNYLKLLSNNEAENKEIMELLLSK